MQARGYTYSLCQENLDHHTIKSCHKNSFERSKYPSGRNNTWIPARRSHLCTSKHSQGEWPSGLYSFRQVAEVKFCRVRSNSGWVTFKA